jgi:hypothetical protein
MYPENFPHMIDFCSKNIQRVVGYMCFPCRGCLAKYEHEYIDCANVSQKAYSQL